MSKLIKIVPPDNDAISTEEYTPHTYYPFLINSDLIDAIYINSATQYEKTSVRKEITRYTVNIYYKDNILSGLTYTNLNLALDVIDQIWEQLKDE